MLCWGPFAACRCCRAGAEAVPATCLESQLVCQPEGSSSCGGLPAFSGCGLLKVTSRQVQLSACTATALPLRCAAVTAPTHSCIWRPPPYSYKLM